jgi:hypothetical protein
VIVGDDELDAAEAAAAQPELEVLQDEPLSRLAISTARIWRRASQSIPPAISTAWLSDHAAFPHLFIPGAEDEVRERGRLAKASRLSSRRLLMAETTEAEKAFDAFVETHAVKHENAAESLKKERDPLLHGRPLKTLAHASSPSQVTLIQTASA